MTNEAKRDERGEEAFFAGNLEYAQLIEALEKSKKQLASKSEQELSASIIQIGKFKAEEQAKRYTQIKASETEKQVREVSQLSVKEISHLDELGKPFRVAKNALEAQKRREREAKESGKEYYLFFIQNIGEVLKNLEKMPIEKAVVEADEYITVIDEYLQDDLLSIANDKINYVKNLRENLLQFVTFQFQKSAEKKAGELIGKLGSKEEDVWQHIKEFIQMMAVSKKRLLVEARQKIRGEVTKVTTFSKEAILEAKSKMKRGLVEAFTKIVRFQKINRRLEEEIERTPDGFPIAQVVGEEKLFSATRLKKYGEDIYNILLVISPLDLATIEDDIVDWETNVNYCLSYSPTKLSESEKIELTVLHEKVIDFYGKVKEIQEEQQGVLAKTEVDREKKQAKKKQKTVEEQKKIAEEKNNTEDTQQLKDIEALINEISDPIVDLFTTKMKERVNRYLDKPFEKLGSNQIFVTLDLLPRAVDVADSEQLVRVKQRLADLVASQYHRLQKSSSVIVHNEKNPTTESKDTASIHNESSLNPNTSSPLPGVFSNYDPLDPLEGIPSQKQEDNERKKHRFVGGKVSFEGDGAAKTIARDPLDASLLPREKRKVKKKKRTRSLTPENKEDKTSLPLLSEVKMEEMSSVIHTYEQRLLKIADPDFNSSLRAQYLEELFGECKECPLLFRDTSIAEVITKLTNNLRDEKPQQSRLMSSVYNLYTNLEKCFQGYTAVKIDHYPLLYIEQKQQLIKSLRELESGSPFRVLYREALFGKENQNKKTYEDTETAQVIKNKLDNLKTDKADRTLTREWERQLIELNKALKDVFNRDRKPLAKQEVYESDADKAARKGAVKAAAKFGLFAFGGQSLSFTGIMTGVLANEGLFDQSPPEMPEFIADEFSAMFTDGLIVLTVSLFVAIQCTAMIFPYIERAPISRPKSARKNDGQEPSVADERAAIRD